MARLAFCAAALLWATAGWAQPAPEPAGEIAAKPELRAEKFMIVAAHPLAADAGLRILKRGGTAVDAAIAAQFMLGLVEPQSSGLGGGGFMLHYERQTRSVVGFDGRETAPASARPDRFLTPSGKPTAFFDAVVGARSVGVPGLTAMLEQAHGRYGKLPWSDLVEPALQAAENGFVVTPRLHKLIAGDRFLKNNPAARALYFRPDGAPLQAGDILRNRAYADSLRLIARRRAEALRRGPIARAIVQAVVPDGPDLKDLAAYRAETRPALCRPYREVSVCGMAPPSSGGAAVLQILGILEHRPQSDDPALIAHEFAEAGRLALADRDALIGDPDFAPIPLDRMLAQDYLAGRAKLIGPAAMGAARPGLAPPEPAAPELPSTTHLSVVDRYGNAASLTSSIENAWGSRLMAAGFMLNNQLTDFSFAPGSVNSVAPGKRPRSSMSPTIVLNGDGSLRAVLGSPGGSRIISYTAQALIGLIAEDLSPAQAAALPHVIGIGARTELENPDLQAALEARGHQVSVGPQTSGLHIIDVKNGILRGGADPRREGVPLGE